MKKLFKRFSGSSRKQPKVSVVIPCYNLARYLGETVESIVTQTFTDWECLIVNDGSPDNTSEVARDLITKYPDKNIRLIEKKNEGLSEARNTGIRQSRGKYILPLDNDDKVDAHMLEKAVGILDAEPDIGIVFSDVIYFGVGGDRLLQAGEFVREKLAVANQLNYCSLYRREVWEVVGGYNPNMIWGVEDWDFWVGALEKGIRGKRIPEPLFFYRVKEESMFTKAVQHMEEIKAQIVLNHPGLYSQETRQWAENQFKPSAEPPNGTEAPTEMEQTGDSKRPLGESFSKIKELLAKNDLDAAEAALREVRMDFPDNLQLINAHGNILGRLGRLGEARKAFEQLIALQPQAVLGYTNLAGVLLMAEQLDEAEKVVQQALRIAPSDPTAENLKTLIREKKGTKSTTGGQTSNKGNIKPDALVSVIVPTYNRPAMLVKAVKSIQAQTYPNFEIIVVNDCGEDVGEIVSSLDSVGNIRYVRHEINKGLGAARNTGIRLANGKYIAYLDDDDWFYTNHLEILVGALENSEYRVAYSDAYRAHQRMENGDYVTYDHDLPFSIDFDAELLLAQNITPVLCVIHEKSLLDEAGYFDETLRVYEDWDLLIRLSLLTPFIHVKQVTGEFSWRTDGTTMTSSRSDFFTLLPEIYRCYEKHTLGNERVLGLQRKLLEEITQTVRLRRAMELMNLIINSPDIAAAIQMHREDLTEEAVQVLQMNAQTALSRGDGASAQWLQNIAVMVKMALTSQDRNL